MTYDHELILIRQTIIEDEIGNQIPTEEEISILCGLRSIGRSEFYNAAAAGLRPELVFVVHGYEYNGERLVKFNEQKYRILRTYATGFEEVELTVERVAANG